MLSKNWGRGVPSGCFFLATLSVLWHFEFVSLEWMKTPAEVFFQTELILNTFLHLWAQNKNRKHIMSN